MAGTNRFLNLVLPDQIPVCILFHRFHELIGDTDRKIGMFNLSGGALHCDELFYIRMVIIQHDH